MVPGEKNWDNIYKSISLKKKLLIQISIKFVHRGTIANKAS